MYFNPTHFSSEDIDPLGKYYVDNTKKTVTIYPRNTYQDITQRFDLQIIFTSPNDAVADNIHAEIPIWQPYTKYAGLDFQYTNSSFLKLNITDNLKITFSLPQGTDNPRTLDNDSNAQIDTKNTNPSITFLYNSPKGLPKEQWIILFDDINVRSTYFIQIPLIVLLALANIAISKLSPIFIKGFFAPILLVLLLTSVGANVVQYLMLSMSPLLVSGFLILEIFLSALSCYLMWRLYKKRKRPVSASHLGSFNVPLKTICYESQNNE